MHRFMFSPASIPRNPSRNVFSLAQKIILQSADDEITKFRSLFMAATTPLALQMLNAPHCSAHRSSLFITSSSLHSSRTSSTGRRLSLARRQHLYASQLMQRDSFSFFWQPAVCNARPSLDPLSSPRLQLRRVQRGPRPLREL